MKKFQQKTSMQKNVLLNSVKDLVTGSHAEGLTVRNGDAIGYGYCVFQDEGEFNNFVSMAYDGVAKYDKYPMNWSQFWYHH